MLNSDCAAPPSKSGTVSTSAPPVVRNEIECRPPFAAEGGKPNCDFERGGFQVNIVYSQKEKTMKMLLVMAAAIGLSAPMAFADCAYHVKNNATVDKKETTASVSKSDQTASDDLALLKKTDRVTDEEKPAE